LTEPEIGGAHFANDAPTLAPGGGRCVLFHIGLEGERDPIADRERGLATPAAAR